MKRYLVVGLGNPGPRYTRTRHNIGFLVLDALARQLDVKINRKMRDIVYGQGRLEDVELTLAKPMAFMNLSGPPVKLLAGRLQLSPDPLHTNERIVVVHDDIDLDFGKMKIKTKGGIGGHNGLRSLVDALGNGDFARLRMGVGRPAAGSEAAEHVLSVFAPQEQQNLPEFIVLGCKAAITVLSRGVQAGMNEFNNMRVTTSRHTTDGGKNGFHIG